MPEIVAVLPKYLQIANHVREQILRGDIQPGSEVPSERQLADDWKVARPTATKALQVLRQQGLVETRPGLGTFVRDAQAHRRANYRYHRYRERGAQYAPDESVEIVAAGVVAAPGYVAEALGLAQPTQAMMRRRVISRQQHGPTEIATSWWPPGLEQVAPRLLVRESLGGIGSVRYVEAVTGRHAVYARDQASARLATDEEAEALALPTPAAVLVYRHTVHDQDDQPLEFAEAIYPPGVWAIEQEYPIES
ncbi:MAG: GntR family transcriptional regulator [Streptosporangiaceae bacterium]